MAALGQTCIMANAIGCDYGDKRGDGNITEIHIRMITEELIKGAIRRQDSLGRCL